MKPAITIEKARKLMNKDGISYTDEEIEKIIITLQKLAEVFYSYYHSTKRAKKLFAKGLSIDDAKKQLAIEGLHYDIYALQSIKKKMELSDEII